MAEDHEKDTPVSGPSARPLVVHVHVPKTAGSAVNALLGRHLGPGHDHVQNHPGGAAALGPALDRFEWISAHMPRPDFETALDRVRRELRWIVALRDPRRQIASHYNWLIEIGRRGMPFYLGHPPHIREIHRRIAASDNSRPDAVIANLEKNPGLFLNMQARFALGTARLRRAEDIAAQLERYDAVLTDDRLVEGLRPLVPGVRPLEDRVNASRYHFDAAVFSHPEVEAFLAERNAADLALWRYVTARQDPERKELHP